MLRTRSTIQARHNDIEPNLHMVDNHENPRGIHQLDSHFSPTQGNLQTVCIEIAERGHCGVGADSARFAAALVRCQSDWSCSGSCLEGHDECGLAGRILSGSRVPFIALVLLPFFFSQFRTKI